MRYAIQEVLPDSSVRYIKNIDYTNRDFSVTFTDDYNEARLVSSVQGNVLVSFLSKLYYQRTGNTVDLRLYHKPE